MPNHPYIATWGGAIAITLGLVAGCSTDTDSTTTDVAPNDVASTGEAESIETTSSALTYSRLSPAARRGERLFKEETFGGNGRTCDTCHSNATGTLTLEQMRARYFLSFGSDPLFRAIDSDDGRGYSYRRLLSEATFKITLPIPPWLKLKHKPNAKTYDVYRTSLTTNNTPALDSFFMWDTRQLDLASQAGDAIRDHAQPRRQPTAQQLSDIAAYEKEALFDRPELKAWAEGGEMPDAPFGKTASEKRGREHFTSSGMCGFCHTAFSLGDKISPLLNDMPQTDVILRLAPVRAGELPGEVNEFHPLVDWVYTNPADGSVQEFKSNDPGASFNNPDPFIIAGGMGSFKVPSLRNIKNGAPYFHDGSAKTLEEVVSHYSKLFADPTFRDNFALPLGFDPRPLTAQEQRDIVAYMKIL